MAPIGASRKGWTARPRQASFVAMGNLNTALVTAPGSRPETWILVLHGIYGAGRNWRSVASALAEARPDVGAVLVDLRQHGDSLGFEPPHTLDAAAADLDRVEPGGEVRWILGHSFGGKVALLHGERRETVRQVWLADSTPATREPSGSAWQMLQVLQELPTSFDGRDAAVAALAARGVDRDVALWMTTNLVRRNGTYRWGIDLDDMEALLRDFFRTDLWRVVEDPPDRLDVHLIRATESSVLDDDDMERIRGAAMRTGRVWLHEVEGGHWLNADNPAAVVDLLAAELSPGP